MLTAFSEVWLRGHDGCNEPVLFFSISSIPCDSGRMVSHTASPPTGTGIANHINPVPLAIVICPAVGIKPKISPSPELVYKHWGKRLYFLSTMSCWALQMWHWSCWQASGSAYLQNEGRIAKRPRGQTKGLGGMEFQSLRLWFLWLFWSSDPSQYPSQLHEPLSCFFYLSSFNLYFVPLK